MKKKQTQFQFNWFQFNAIIGTLHQLWNLAVATFTTCGVVFDSGDFVHLIVQIYNEKRSIDETVEHKQRWVPLRLTQF